MRWFGAYLAVPIHDHYGQTEMGMCVNNHHGLSHPVRPGRPGWRCPGYRVVVLDDDSNELGPNQPGILAIDMGEIAADGFSGLSQSGDAGAGGRLLPHRRQRGVRTRTARSALSGARTMSSPVRLPHRARDVESALIEHPAVIEAAVIGVPDPERTEIVKAFVILGRGHQGSPELAEELRAHVKRRLSAHAYPKLIDFVAELPKTPSGKIQRHPAQGRGRETGESIRKRNADQEPGFPDYRRGSGLGAAWRAWRWRAQARGASDVNEAAGPALADELGAAALFVRTDVTSGPEGRAAVAAAVQNLLRLDVAVNCAGVAPGERIVGRDGPMRWKALPAPSAST